MAEMILKIERICLMILGLAMTLVMFINACSRYIFSKTFLWAEETVRICFVWAMFIAISELFVRWGHTGFDVFSGKNRWTKVISRAVTDIVLMVIGFNFVYFGRAIVAQVGAVPLASTKLPGMVFYIPGILAGAGWIVIGIADIIQMIRKKGAEPEEVKE